MRYILGIILVLILISLSHGQEVVPTNCSALYKVGDTVVLTATPKEDSYFVGWLADVCYGTGQCKFVMPARDIYVDAVYDLLPIYNLYVYVFGKTGGKVVSNPAGIDCTMGKCKGSFRQGTRVVLIATGPTGFTWRGLGCSGTGTCSITMTKSKAINVRIR